MSLLDNITTRQATSAFTRDRYQSFEIDSRPHVVWGGMFNDDEADRPLLSCASAWTSHGALLRAMCETKVGSEASGSTAPIEVLVSHGVWDTKHMTSWERHLPENCFVLATLKSSSAGAIAPPSLFQKVYDFLKSQDLRSAVKAFSRIVEDHIAAQNYSALSAAIKGLDLDSLPRVLWIAALRTTFPIRSKVTYWPVLFDEIERRLKAKGEDGDQFFIGLRDARQNYHALSTSR